MLLSLVLSTLELSRAIHHLTIHVTVAGAKLAQSRDVLLRVGLVLPHLQDLLVLHPLDVRFELDPVSQLVLHAVLHLSLDLRSFLLALGNQLRHAIVGCDEDAHAALEQLSLDLLVGTLVCLAAELEPEPFDLADQVTLLVCIREQQSLILTDLTLQEVCLAPNMSDLVANTLVRIGALAL